MLAILLDGLERARFVTAIESESLRKISTASVLEAAMVGEGRWGDAAGGDLDLFLHRAGVEIVPFDADQLTIARSAFRLYGKGRHPAGLNFGDCIAYALARWDERAASLRGRRFFSH